MSAKRRGTRSPPARDTEDPTALRVHQLPGESGADALARVSLDPAVQAAATLMAFGKNFGELSINKLVEDLGTQCVQAHTGDMKRAESMLVTQAHTLDALFHNLARRASMNMGEYLGAAETYLRLALKAQAQSRATLETLATIKNPQPVAFVQQANIAHGPQQVNNGANSPTSTRTRAHAGNLEMTPNELSTLTHDERKRLDLGTAAGAGAAHPAVETVGAIHRAKDGGR